MSRSRATHCCILNVLPFSIGRDARTDDAGSGDGLVECVFLPCYCASLAADAEPVAHAFQQPVNRWVSAEVLWN